MASQVTMVESAIRPLLEAAGLREYADFVDCPRGEVVSRTGTTLTRRLEFVSGGRVEVLYLKRYRYSGERWRHRFRRHKGAIEARNYGCLRACGIGVPDVIAYGSRRRGWQLLDAFLMTRAVPEGAAVEDVIAQLTPSSRRELLRESAEAVARMHAAHFYHCDLQWRNILVRRAGNGFSIFLIDSSRGGRRLTPAGRRHGCIRDLASLDKMAQRRLSRGERLRWLRWYAAARKWSDRERAIIRSVFRYAKSKVD